MGENRPRHIRDIAHLYLSRLDGPARPGERSILVAGTTRECFPAFHVANIAVTLSTLGHRVDLVELSGHPLNAGFFLSLPAPVYVDEAGDGSAVSALGQVTLTRSLPDRRGLGDGDRNGSGHIRVVHLPPVQDRRHLAALEDALEATDSPNLLYLAQGEGPAREAGQETGIYVVDVDGPRRSAGPENAVLLGRIDRWRSSLGDPIPPVLRDPQSMLGRAYRSLCESLVSPLLGTTQGSRHEGAPAPRRGVRARRKTRSASIRTR